MDQDQNSADQRLSDISATLVEARRTATALAGFPGETPQTFGEAYETQRISIETWDDDLVGWKIGGVPPAFIEQSGASQLAGPIFASTIVHAVDGDVAPMPVFDGGFAAIEPEFVIELGESRANDKMYIGVEIASSPVPALNDYGPLAIISDFGNNHGLLLGPEIENWQELETEQAQVITHIDGEHIGTRDLDDFRAWPRKSLTFMLNHAKAHNIEMPAGTLVSTGAITGVHEAVIGATSRLDFGEFGKLDLVLTKAEASA